MELLADRPMMFNMVLSIVIIVVLSMIKWYVVRVIKRDNIDPMQQFMGKKVANSIYIGSIIIALLIVWYKSSEYVVAFIGLFSAGMAIAMRDILLNVIGGIYILWVDPFKVGDRVEIAGKVGDVIDIKLLHFTMLEIGNRISGEQSTGRMIHVPNMQIFSFPLANYEKGFSYIWNEVKVVLDSKSNWELAKEIINELLQEQTGETVELAQQQINEAGKKYLIYYNNLTPIVYTSMKDNKIELTARYLCEPRKARVTEHILWEAILKKFEDQSEIKLV